MDIIIVVAITFGILVFFLLAGIPIPFAFAAALVFIVTVGEYDTSFLLSAGFRQIKSVILLALPFFIVAGYMMEKGGISAPLINLVNSLVGRIRGGLGVVTVLACGVFGAISGMATSAVAAIGTIMIPRMKEDGYPLGYLSALVAVSAMLAIVIPPSGTMIIFGWIANVSVAACFLATVGPGILLIILFSIINIYLMRKEPIKVAPHLGLKDTAKDVGKGFKNAFWALLMPIFVLGGIYGGLITPTEAAAVAAFYAIPVGLLVYRGFNLRGMFGSMKQGAILTGVLMLMVFFVVILVRIFTMENVPQAVVAALTSISDNKYVILAMINLFLFMLGLIMDDGSACILSTVVLMPTVRAIGVNTYHYAAIVGVSLGMGLATPPCAPLLYLAARISGAKFETMLKPLSYFLIFAFFPVLVVTTYVPAFPLFLPRLLGYVD